MKKEKQKEEEEVTYTFMQKLSYLFIIPLLFIVTGVLGYLTYEGKNVFDIAQTFFPEKTEVGTTVEDEERDSTSQKEQPTKDTATETVANREMILLEREISEKQREIVKLSAQLELANNKIKELEDKQDEVKASTKELANLYERMSTKKAAQIFVELEEDMALRILTELSTAKTSSILGQLEPEQAARFTKLLAEME